MLLSQDKLLINSICKVLSQEIIKEGEKVCSAGTCMEISGSHAYLDGYSRLSLFMLSYFSILSFMYLYLECSQVKKHSRCTCGDLWGILASLQTCHVAVEYKLEKVSLIRRELLIRGLSLIQIDLK